MYKLYRAYFAVALLLGFHKHVFRISNRWGGLGDKVGLAKYRAAWAATQMLIDDGYHVCPSCHWAIQTKDEHVNVIDSYCREERLLHLRQRRRDDRWLPPEGVAQLATLGRTRRGYRHEQTLH